MRLAIARSMLHSPDLLLLDEPTNHLDKAAVDWLSHHLQVNAVVEVKVNVVKVVVLVCYIIGGNIPHPSLFSPCLPCTFTPFIRICLV